MSLPDTELIYKIKVRSEVVQYLNLLKKYSEYFNLRPGDAELIFIDAEINAVKTHFASLKMVSAILEEYNASQ